MCYYFERTTLVLASQFEQQACLIVIERVVFWFRRLPQSLFTEFPYCRVRIKLVLFAMSEEEIAVKKRKMEELEPQVGDNKASGESTLIKPFSDFQLLKILNENSLRKVVSVHGKFPQVGESEAVVIMEKTPFSAETVKNILSKESNADQGLQNDIYGTYNLFPICKDNGIKTTLIYPATEKHIAKYSAHEMFMIEETAENYNEITKPHLMSEKFSIQWVYNILEKKSEADRIVCEDPDPEIGFILLPDMKWDRKQVEDLYLVAIVHKHNIKSIRDLNEGHLPLLRNILQKGQEAILEQFKIPSSKLRIYLHYQPSYYHLHVHFTHLRYDAPGSGVERAHLLTDVINNIEMMSDYYQKKTLSFLVKDNDSLYHKYKEIGKI